MHHSRRVPPARHGREPAYGPQEIASLEGDQVAWDFGRVTYAKSELDQRGEPWVRENGTWLVDDCSRP